MKKILALTLAMIMIFGLVACGGGGGTTSGAASTPTGTTSAPPAGSGTTTPDTPKEPAKTHLNYAFSAAIVGLDPHGTGFSKTTALQLYKWIYDPLVDVTDDAEVYGCLAES